MEPMAEASATAEPLIPAKIMFATMQAWASPPRICPTRLLAKPMMRTVVPPRFIRSPARMKKGTAMSGNESIPVNIRCATSCKGTPIARMTEKPVIPITSARGIPITKQTTKVIVISAIICHPPFSSGRRRALYRRWRGPEPTGRASDAEDEETCTRRPRGSPDTAATWEGPSRATSAPTGLR